MTTIAARLRDPSRSRARVSIAVPLVRQHHDTCFPASLTMVARHFGREADHLAVAEAICFDGTPTHSARAWAESNGYRVFELTLTWETIVALADRGLPFVVTTLGATAGHAMVVTGYDALRGTVHLRDPSAPTLVELFADELLARFASTGPTAMVLLPPGREDALEGLVLVDAALHDRLHRVHASLTAHDRATAATEVAALEHQAPGHRLTLRASFSLARCDGNDEGALAAARSPRRAGSRPSSRGTLSPNRWCSRRRADARRSTTASPRRPPSPPRRTLTPCSPSAWPRRSRSTRETKTARHGSLAARTGWCRRAPCRSSCSRE
jgi:hypothetical protein